MDEMTPERYRELVYGGKLLALESAMRTLIGNVASREPEPDLWLRAVLQAALQSSAEGEKSLPTEEGALMFGASHALLAKLFAPLDQDG